MDLIYKRIKPRRGHRQLHRYLHAAYEAREQRPSRHSAASAETHALLKGLGSLIPAERRATGWVIEIVPEGASLTYALGVRCGR